jgi:CheY-like chemotaxis protein
MKPAAHHPQPQPQRSARRLSRADDSACDACDAIPAARRRAMHVLVVEDDPVQRMLLMLFLERLRIAGRLVADGEQAVNEVRSGTFTLVLTDCLLPVVVDGVAATLAIRRREREPGRGPLPIVAATASCMKEQCRCYLESGMDRVLRKPYSVREFGDLIRNYMPATHAGGFESGSDATEAVDVACAGGR